MLLLSVTLSNAQDRITFTYDNAGNQIQRSLCLQCTTSKTENVKPKEIIALKEEDLQKFFLIGGNFNSYENSKTNEKLKEDIVAAVNKNLDDYYKMELNDLKFYMHLHQ